MLRRRAQKGKNCLLSLLLKKGLLGSKTTYFHFHTFPFIFKYSFTSERMDIHTLLYFSFVLQTLIFKNGNVFKVNIESLQDGRKL